MIDCQRIYAAFEAYLLRSGHPFRPQAALIDMDGVLYDSMPRHADAWMSMTSEIGMTCSREEFFLYEGMTGRATIKHLFRKYLEREATDAECETLYRRKTELFAANPHRPLMPGADMMLKALGAFNLKRILVTGSGQHTLLDALSKDYPGVFSTELMVTAADVRRGKPDPEPYQTGQQKGNIAPWESLAIENAPLGVESAFRAGCFTAAVATGPIPKESLREAGADLVFSTMQEFAMTLPMLLRTAQLQS